MERSLSVIEHVENWQQPARKVLSELVKQEQQAGCISTTISIEIAVALMMATSRAIADLWREQVVPLETVEEKLQMIPLNALTSSLIKQLAYWRRDYRKFADRMKSCRD